MASSALVVSVLAFVAGAPVPTPIGRGPAYRPAARGPVAADPRFPCVHGDLQAGLRVHLELFANRRAVVVPTGIGVAGVRSIRFGRIEAARCHSALWTLDPTGVVHLVRPGLRLGDLFAVWRRPLGRRRLLSFRARRGRSEVLVFRNGRRLRTPAASLRLRDGDEIVLEIDGYVPPHRSYLFPRPRR